MSEATKTLAYRYRLRLTPAQEDILDSSQEQLRLVWNHLVRSQRHAEREWTHGRAASVKQEMVELSLIKEARGQAVVSARKIAAERGVSQDEALRLMRREFIEKVATIPKRKKDGSRCLRIARRRMATRYADEIVNAKVDHYYSPSLEAGMYNALRDKFKKCSEMWIKSKFRRPRFKRKGEPVALQKQVNDTTPFTLKRFSDLSNLGGQALEKCEVIIHRPLPDSAEIKQIAVAGKRGARYLIVMFKAVASDVAKNFPVTNRTVGVDPGIKVGLTMTPLDSPDFGTSDSFKKQLPLAKDARFLKRLRRLQRKHDRQRRQNNADCFDEKGRWIKGRRLHTESQNMKSTQARITGMNTHLAESRRDFYHNAACDILRSFDNVAIGKWRPAQTRQRKPSTPSPKGLGAARRAINRISYDHAISLFISYLKDKADRSTTQKQIQDVGEAGSTRNCPKCGKPTGPKGTEGLAERDWKCGECDTSFKRDAASAWQIAKNFSMTAVASTVELSESKDSAQKAKGRREARKRDEGARKSNVPVADQASPVRDATASAILSQKPPGASG